ncbi:MAG: hypothetical protein U0U70_17150 [Chitinophagaceae bacterium]
MKKILRPYLFIILCGIMAYAPVSFMLRALKNDVIALEYPINQFISQSIRHGEVPGWFNTWGMGFLLQSNLTWSLYSTPQVFFSFSAFDYNIYTLHIEFLFFLLLAGWGMFYLLKKFFLQDERMAQLLSVCYMLSGFMAGSTQWMLYITAAAFIPLLLASLLHLLQKPSFLAAARVSVCYTLMFTSVYAAFTIISTYCLLFFLVSWLLLHRSEKQLTGQRMKFLLISGLLTTILCLPCLYFTLEVLQNIDRGSGLAADPHFFNSNYLHPGALTSLLFPFSSVKMSYPNTEGTMLNTYTGLLTLLVLPYMTGLAVKQKDKQAFIWAGITLLFLLASFGDMTPVRKALNILPGFSFFRNPAIFRLYFILFLLLLTARGCRQAKFQDILLSRPVRYCLLVLAAVSLVVILIHAGQFKKIFPFSASRFVAESDFSMVLFISSCIQLLLLLKAFVLIRLRAWKLLTWLFAGDLVLNTLLCTPFFSVSSYTPRELNNIYRPVSGFPVQQERPSAVPTVFTDAKGNNWQNMNVYSKKIASAEGYWGPLVLKNMFPEGAGAFADKPLVAANDSGYTRVTVLLQQPDHILCGRPPDKADTVTLLQNYYPGGLLISTG